MRTAIPPLAALLATSAIAAPPPAPVPPLTLVGKVAPRPANAIAANTISIGTEAIDRDFSTYDAWRAYLGPLGAKHARLQGGWARTDRGGGRLDFGWLDGIVADMNRQGVRPWVTLGYGNPAYENGGTAQRDSPLPAGAGRAAWLGYVRAAVARYRGRIDYWEIWNEPDLVGRFSGAEFGTFAAETAQVIRTADPAAKISVAGFAGVGRDGASPFVLEALRTFKAAGGTADFVGYHAYAANPDTSYPAIERFRGLIRTIDPAWDIRQGESGAPSLNQPLFALSDTWWTEEAQAKWMLRRLIGDLGRSIWTSVFTLTDLHYTTRSENNASFVTRPEQRTSPIALNSKGLLETRRYAPGTPDDDRTVVREKVGYRALQSATAILDARLRPVPGACTASRPGITVVAFRRDDGRLALAAWRATDQPGVQPAHEEVAVQCARVTFAGTPLYVDPLTSTAYRTAGLVAAHAPGMTIARLPVYDSPVLLVDSGLVEVW